MSSTKVCKTTIGKEKKSIEQIKNLAARLMHTSDYGLALTNSQLF